MDCINIGPFFIKFTSFQNNDQQPPARYLMGLYTGARIGWFQVGDSVDKRSSKGWQESLIQ